MEYVLRKTDAVVGPVVIKRLKVWLVILSIVLDIALLKHMYLIIKTL